MSTKCTVWISDYDKEPEVHAYTDVLDIKTRDEGTVYVAVSPEAIERGLTITFGGEDVVSVRWRTAGSPACSGDSSPHSGGASDA